MGCCGEKSRNLTGLGEGRIVPFDGEPFRLPVEKFSGGVARIRVCHGCPHQTWLTAAEYLEHRAEELPVVAGGPGRKLFCSRGGFWIPGKAFIMDSTCPENRWLM